MNIGDMMWVATFTHHKEIQIPCPDCGGTKKIHITLWNGEEYDIACVGCTKGYEEPTGYLTAWEHKEAVEHKKITGIEIYDSRMQYKSGCYSWYQEDVFDNEADAIERAKVKLKIADEEEIKRSRAKIKDHKSWAWHVHYYRSKLKDAERDIKRYTENLNYAKDKTKEV